MNVLDVLKYGHKEVLGSLEGLSDSLKETPGVTVTWSVKDTLSHIAAYEHYIGDALSSVAEPEAATPVLDIMKASSKDFNDRMMAQYKAKSFQEVLEDYNTACERTRQIAEKLGPDKLREVGTIPWYGPEYSLDDFICYASYAHKREHVALIKAFLKRVEANS